MLRSRFVLVLLAVVVAANCSDRHVLGPNPQDRPAPLPESPGAPSFAISDAVHGGGNAHFFWLAPIVADPDAFNGDFDGSQSPEVRICDLADCVGLELAVFTMASGPGSETVRLVSEDEHYIVNWHTDQFAVTPGSTYRISVSVAGTAIGYADVAFGGSGKDAKNLTTNETIGLKDGRTLPVKFRIEDGAVFPIDPAAGGTIEALAGTATVTVPAGAVSGETGFTVASVPPADQQLSIIELGPSGLTFPPDKPVVVTLSYDESALAGVAEEDLALNTFEDGEWIVVPGSSVDPANNAASAPFFHFSKASVGPAENAVVCASDGNPHTFDTVQGALDAVMDGGTVSICGETQQTDSVSVAKAVTIEGRGGARPVLQTTTARGGVWVEAVAAGTVTFDGIDFQNHSPRDANASPVKNTYSIRARDTFDHIVIRNSSFVAATGTTGSVVLDGRATPPGSHVEIIDSQFAGGLLGLNVVVVPDVDVTGSTFGDHATAGIWYQTASGRVEASTLGPNCGAGQCLMIQGSGQVVDVVGNTFVETNTGYSNRHEMIWVRTSGTGRIDDNDFDGCGGGACIRATGGALAEITNNRFTIDSSHATEFVINGTDGSGGTRVPLFPAPTLVVTDNVITGVGTDQGGYATVHSAIQAEWGAMVSAHRNTITNMATGISAYGAPGVVTDASNNVIDNVRTGIGVWGGTQVSASFNDITNAGFQIDIPDSDPTLSDLTCNWWGDAAGPSTISGGVPASTYTPFATAPIANTGASCGGP